VLDLSEAADEILVVEEKRPFVEQQVRAIVHEAGHTTPVREIDVIVTPRIPGHCEGRSA
jgi:TPP-dependent indolepyruvate ferredoxin oxidoreductase alpha subunit